METPLDIIDRLLQRWPKGFDLTLGRIRRLVKINGFVASTKRKP